MKAAGNLCKYTVAETFLNWGRKQMYRFREPREFQRKRTPRDMY